MMYEIIILLIVLTIGMAKHGRRGKRWTANMKKVQLDSSIALLTTAANALVAGDMIASGTESFRLLSIKGIWSLRGLTSGEGPLIFGVAHSDYSAAEIEECLETSAGLTRGDKISAEQSNRLVRRIGMFDGNAVDDEINDGKPLHTRLNWHITEGLTLRMWCWNKSGGTLTTGALILFQGSLVIKWSN